MGRELLDGATPRPWTARGTSICVGDDGLTPLVIPLYTERDAALIVAAVNEYEALLDIASAAEWACDCRNVEALEDQYEAAMDEAELALARLDALRNN